MWFCISVFVTFVHAASNLKSLNHKINYKKKWAHEILTRKKFWPTRKNFKLTNTHEEVLDPPNTDEKKFQSHEIPMKSRWHDGGRFLLFDSGIGDINRTFIFATNDEIDMLADPSQWFGDGTFKPYPQAFSQIYTIHALVNHDLLPCVFAHLPFKAEIVYEQYFTTVCNAVRNNNGNDPDGLFVDFQTAAINAIQNVLLQTDISGCFFHLSSNLDTWIKRARLQQRYMNDPQFALQLRMITALAFLPPHDVVNSFN